MMSFVKSILQTFFTRISLIIIGLAGGIIKARWLGVEGVGILALLTIINGMAFRFGGLGFGSAFAYFLAKEKVSIVRLSKLLWLVGGVMSVLSIFMLLLIWRQDFSPWNDLMPILFYVCLTTVPLFFFNNYIQRILSAKLKITEINVSEIIAQVSNLLFVLILVVIFNLGLLGAMLAFALSIFLVFFYLLIQLNKITGETTVKENDGYTNKSLPLELWRYCRWNYLLMFLNFFIEDLPLILLKTFAAGNIPVGLFAKAQGIGRQSRIVALPIAQMLFPYTATSKREDASRRTNILCRNTLVVMLLIVVFMMIFIKPLILILYGEAFLPAAKVFYALSLGIVIWPIGHFLGIHVAASGSPKQVFLVSLLTSLSAVVVCSLMISKYGAIGAGLSVSGIYTIHTFLRLLIYMKFTETSFIEICLPRWTDLEYYRKTVKMLFLRFTKETKVS